MLRAALLLPAAMLVAGAGPTDRAARLIGEARSALGGARSPAEQIAALGRASAAQEAALSALRSALRAGAARREEIGARIAENRRELSAMLAALQRIERAPRLAALAHPDGPLASARAGMMLAALAPALEAEAQRLAGEMTEIGALEARRREIAAETERIMAALQQVRAQMAALTTRNLPNGDMTLVKERLGKESEALARIAMMLKALPEGPDEARAGEEAEAGAPPPVAGGVVGRFGEAGLEGVTMRTAPYATVRAPRAGVIRFAAPFGEDGVVAMLEPEPDLLIVFAGLGAAFHAPGDLVRAGEAIGRMSGPPPAERNSPSIHRRMLNLPPETLYLEVRRGGEPADPALWFAFDNMEGDGQ